MFRAMRKAEGKRLKAEGSVEALRGLALKALQHATPAGSYEIRQALAELESTANAADQLEAGHNDADASALHAAGRAFEKGTQPVCTAIVSALQAGDMEALKGLRALLPHLLEDVNAEPVLGDVLAHQVGKAVMEGLNSGAKAPSKGATAP